MALTNIEARNANSRAKPHKLADEKGLYLLVTQTGKYWRFDYRFAGKRKTLAIGVYPEVTLADAREQARQSPTERWLPRSRKRPSSIHRKVVASPSSEPGKSCLQEE